MLLSGTHKSATSSLEASSRYSRVPALPAQVLSLFMVYLQRVQLPSRSDRDTGHDSEPECHAQESNEQPLAVSGPIMICTRGSAGARAKATLSYQVDTRKEMR